ETIDLNFLSEATVARAGHARDSRQVRVNRVQVMVGQLLKGWPGHNLEQIAIERRVEAVRGNRDPIAVWMQVVMVHAVSQRVEELGESSGRNSSVVWRQIARHDVRRDGAGRHRAHLTDVPTAAQIRGGIHDLRW